ncbi:hypothetical protein GSY74_03415, partial [Sulfurovum sp. bin170]|uniref:O-antigen ligase family protein n=1 Tax=Sulfurovum sp. bin170 TaxID=2695268 RepID=UPI0013E07CE1
TYFYSKKSEKYISNDYTVPLGRFGTSHSMYFQDLVGKGIIGLFTLLSIIFLSLFYLFRDIVKNSPRKENFIVQLSLISSLIAISIYGFVQEIFYTQSIQIIFWIVVASSLVVTKNSTNYKKAQKLYSRLLILIVLLIPIHLYLQVP